MTKRYRVVDFETKDKEPNDATIELLLDLVEDRTELVLEPIEEEKEWCDCDWKSGTICPKCHSKYAGNVRSFTGCTYNSEETVSWEKEFDDKFLAKEDGRMVVKDGLSTLWSYNIKSFIRELLKKETPIDIIDSKVRNEGAKAWINMGETATEEDPEEWKDPNWKCSGCKICRKDLPHEHKWGYVDIIHTTEGIFKRRICEDPNCGVYKEVELKKE